MADLVLVVELRRLINEPDQTIYTDIVLSNRLDLVLGDVESLASIIWREKAATYAGLIDIQEGSSNRKMSQLYQQALRMSGSFNVNDVPVRRAARTRQIERP